MSAPVFAVVGHPNKGKSSIVATLAMDDSVKIGPDPGTTHRCRRYPMRLDDEELYALVDTPGFQRARRALQWMRQHETTADRHGEVVRAFVEAHRNSDRFPDECELLQPIIDGAGILYVVDGSVPYGEDYEPEMEVLRWTGQPSMALINPIGPADYLEQWQAALGQYFKVVRVFNAVMAEFAKHTELLRGFGQLRESWRHPLERAVTSLEADRTRTRRLVARCIADCLADLLGHSLDRRFSAEEDCSSIKPKLEQQYRENLRRREQRCRDEVEELYSHRRIEREEAELPLLAEDLFAEKTWLIFGLGRRELMATGAMGGAATGAVVDAHFAGASLMTGALLGAGVGGFLGWWTANRLIRIKVMNLPLGGKRLIAGPTRNVNFPHVVFNRARLHHFVVARRNHAVRGMLRLSERPNDVLSPLSGDQRSAMEKCFARLRKSASDMRVIEELTTQIETTIAEADALTPVLGPEPRTARNHADPFLLV
jgi:hypothetical protein